MARNKTLFEGGGGGGGHYIIGNIDVGLGKFCRNDTLFF